MDWKRAIEINAAALARIIAGALALLGFSDATSALPSRMPLDIYSQVSRILRPAESAVRRVIVMAARGLVVPVSIFRPMSPEVAARLALRKHGTGALVFPLYDARKTFRDDDRQVPGPTGGPRIRVVDGPDPRAPIFLNQPAPVKALGDADVRQVGRRLMMLKRALETLPQQARRMARWQARRAAEAATRILPFLSPLRPGPPPGRNKSAKDEVNIVLRECHALAGMALAADTS